MAATEKSTEMAEGELERQQWIFKIKKNVKKN